MPAGRLASLAPVTLFLALFLVSSTSQGQDNKGGPQDPLGKLLSQNTAGTKINEAQMTWASLTAVIGFIIVCALVSLLIRLLALLVVIACYVGGSGSICWLLHEKAITTWEQLAVVVLVLGSFGAVLAVTAKLYILKDAPATPDVSRLERLVDSASTELDKQKQRIEELLREVQALKEKRGSASPPKPPG